MKSTRPFIMAHGGAGQHSMTKTQRASLEEALAVGYDMLIRGLSALEAVEASIKALEASGLFNAGVGSHLQLDGIRRMDASIMEGRNLQAGAVAAIEGIRHPISAARLVLEHTNHVLLVGPPAGRMARQFNLERQALPSRGLQKGVRTLRPVGPSLRIEGPDRRSNQETTRTRRVSQLETVGAVALDRTGTVAAGASTGGIGVMLPGRVGDSPLIGSGVYADDEAGAVSMTGHGESIIRIAVAKEIILRLSARTDPSQAARLVLDKMAKRVEGYAGALVLARNGRFAIRHTTPRMAAGYWGGKGKPVVADHFK